MDQKAIDFLIHCYTTGNSLDLSGIVYGPAVWAKNGFNRQTSPYYFFLAGLVKELQFSKIIEVGTHFGGSTQALYKGLESHPEGLIVTIDVTYLNKKELSKKSNILRVQGSGSDLEVQKRSVSLLNSPYCDLLYIDALKNKKFVFDTINGFSSMIDIKMIILDDISIGKEMREMWEDVQKLFGTNMTVDLSLYCPQIRGQDVGLGVICLDRHILKMITN